MVERATRDGLSISVSIFILCAFEPRMKQSNDGTNVHSI